MGMNHENRDVPDYPLKIPVSLMARGFVTRNAFGVLLCPKICTWAYPVFIDNLASFI